MVPSEYTRLLSSELPINHHYSSNGNSKPFIISMHKDVFIDKGLDGDGNMYWKNRSSYGPLDMNDLLICAEDPKWQKIRFVLFYTFWLSILTFFILACFTIYCRIDTDHCKSLSPPHKGITSTQRIPVTLQVDE